MRQVAKFTVTIIFAGCGLSLAQQSPHRELRYRCDECHISVNWKQVHFEHQRTGFVLEGRHVGARCTGCHTLDNFSRVNIDCIACHTDVHQGKLAIACNRCHSPRGWSVFNALNAHAGTSFPLIGPHAKLDCRACHISEIEGEFSFMKSQCSSCHSADFQQADNPPHTQMGFGTQCEECHFPISWQPANFARHENYFPIYRGSHSGEWNSCRDCHPNMQDHGIFNCLGCHEHEQTRMNDKHNEVVGYAYDSNACYTCHPGGRGGD
jgi:hypothetical protein